jgi:electron transfer flavoprotein alpha subunit
LAAGAAARTGRPCIAYCVSLVRADGAIEAESQILGGKIRARTRTAVPAVFAVTPGAYREEGGREGGQATIERLEPPAALGALRTRFIDATKPDPNEVDITQARRIVCVGRGIGEKGKIALAAEVATLLEAEIAGSRPVIDNGWLPKARQVGKSGRTVKPGLYLALGVSGAPEHLEGMGGAEFIVAVNSDPKAPIFGVAHLGTTLDLFDLLPALSARLRRQES